MCWIDPQAKVSKTGVAFFHRCGGPDAAEKKRSAKRKEKAKTLRCSKRRSVCGRIRTVLIWHTKFGFQFNPNEHPKHNIDFQWFYGLQEYHCRNPQRGDLGVLFCFPFRDVKSLGFCDKNYLEPRFVVLISRTRRSAWFWRYQSVTSSFMSFAVL